MKLVKDVMVRDIITITPFATIREALLMMKQHSVKSLVVEKQGEHDAWGLITYTNVLKTVVAEDGDIDLLNVYDACARTTTSKVLWSWMTLWPPCSKASTEKHSGQAQHHQPVTGL